VKLLIIHTVEAKIITYPPDGYPYQVVMVMVMVSMKVVVAVYHVFRWLVKKRYPNKQPDQRLMNLEVYFQTGP
jgi:hypothetical protein